jgi:hypothetical protein
MHVCIHFRPDHARHGPGFGLERRGGSMNRLLAGHVFASTLSGGAARSAEPNAASTDHALFAWAGDRHTQGHDVLLSIDADPPSAPYGRMLPVVEADRQTGCPHYTECAPVQGAPAVHGVIVRDIADAAGPVEVSRPKIGDGFFPHRTAWNPSTKRLVAPPDSKDDNRLCLLKLGSGTAGRVPGSRTERRFRARVEPGPSDTPSSIALITR